MFIGWAHDSNKTQDMHEEILLTGEEITAVLSAWLVFTTHHPLGLLLHWWALGCATHTAWWCCHASQVLHGLCVVELLARVSGSKPSCYIIRLCFSLIQALYRGTAMTWTSRWDLWSRPDLLELERWPEAGASMGRIRMVENLPHEMGLLDSPSLVQENKSSREDVTAVYKYTRERRVISAQGQCWQKNKWAWSNYEYN